MRGRTRATAVVSTVGIGAILVVGAHGGVAAAVSGGGYNPNQNDCQWNNDAWNTPPGEQYAGCHSVAINVESGGQTNGDADAGNTRYVSWGDNQNPVDNSPQGPPTELSIGYPGDTGMLHAGCVAANTGTCGVYVNDGPTYEDGVTGTLTGGKADSTTNPANGEPFNDPGWVVGGPNGSTSTDPDC